MALVLLTAQGPDLAAQERASGSTPEDSVRAVESSRARALLQADTAALARMVADEFIEISRLGQLRTKLCRYCHNGINSVHSCIVYNADSVD